MKRFILTSFFLLCALFANAQVRLGGSIAIDAKTPKGSEISESANYLKVELGYIINEKWEFGFGAGFDNKQNVNYIKDNNQTSVIWAPYVRYIFADMGPIGFFVDGGLDLSAALPKEGEAMYDIWVGVRAGLKLDLSDKLSLVSHLGQWGFREVKDSYKEVGMNLSDGLSFGLNYIF